VIDCLEATKGVRGALEWILVMYNNLKMNYNGNLTRGRKKWTKICNDKWFLMKCCRKFWRRPRELSPSIMTMF
jgi:hypothetical protein